MSQKTVNLSLSDHVLTGKYSLDHEHILVLLDTSSGIPFSVQLPDLMSPVNKEFMFKNLPLNGNGADVTITTSANQRIDGRDFSHTVKPFNFSSFRSNLKNSWILLDFATHSDTGVDVEDPMYIMKNGKRLWRFSIGANDELLIDYDTLRGAASAPVWSIEYQKFDPFN